MADRHDTALVPPPDHQRLLLTFKLTVGVARRLRDFAEQLP
jgi:hypothetical protein